DGASETGSRFKACCSDSDRRFLLTTRNSTKRYPASSCAESACIPAIMIPAGYMAKRICRRPDWLKAERVNDIYSVSSCVSSDFADYINFWKHNGYWLFDCPEAILDLAIESNLDLEGTLLFYYEIYEFEFDQDHHSWTSVSAE